MICNEGYSYYALCYPLFRQLCSQSILLSNHKGQPTELNQLMRIGEQKVPYVTELVPLRLMKQRDGYIYCSPIVWIKERSRPIAFDCSS